MQWFSISIPPNSSNIVCKWKESWVKHMTELNVYHLVKLPQIWCSKIVIKKSILNAKCSMGARPSVIKGKAILSIFQQLRDKVRRTYVQREVNYLTVAQENHNGGHKPLNSDHQLKPTVLQNYTAELGMTSKFSLKQSCITKINSWFTADHS